MEVGKLIMNVVQSKAHMTLSVKPFGCMPSAGVSDGVQSAITEKFPGTIFCPVETSGDGARELLLARADVPLQGEAGGHRRVRARAATSTASRASRCARSSTRTRASRARSTRRRTRYAGTAADLVAEVAPYITKTRAQRWQRSPRRRSRRDRAKRRASRRTWSIAVVKSAVEAAPEVAARLKEDVALFREARRAKKKASQPAMDAAAE